MYFEYTQLTYPMLSKRRQIGLVFYLISDYFNCRYKHLNPEITQSQQMVYASAKCILLYDVIDQSVHFAIETERQGLVAVLI